MSYQLKSIKSLGTTSARMAAIRLKSANKYIFRAILSLASAALLTRMFGMLNQVIVTSNFGIGATMDAYFVASNVPTLMALLIASAVEASVIPVYARVRLQGNKESTSLLFSTLLNILIIGAILLTVVMLIFGHQIILLSAPGLDPLRVGLADSLVPIIYPALVLMIVIGFLECILNSEGQFGWPAYSGLLVPLTGAVLVLAVGKSQGVVVLCVGMLVGLCLQLCMVILRARRAGIVYRPVLNLRLPELSSILIAAWPVLVGSLISQGSPLVDQIFASSLSAGSISALNYALKLISVPTGVIFASVGRAALPYLSQQAHQNNLKAFKETLHLYLWVVGIGTTMLSLFMLVLAHPIVQVLFQRGVFSAEDTNHTATVLVGFAIGLTPLALGYIAAKAFSALGKTRVLMYSTIFTVIVNAIFDYIFAHFWQSFGIALATSLVNFCSMFFLLFTLSRAIGKLNFFAPPQRLMDTIDKVKRTYNLYQNILQAIIMFIVFMTGIIGFAINSFYTLRLSLGSVFMLIFLRYHYALVMAWIIVDAFIGSTVPFFNGNNINTALTVPTLLVMTSIPINQTFKHMPALAFLFIFLLWTFVGIVVSPLSVDVFLRQWLLYLDGFVVSVLTVQMLISRQRAMKLIDTILGLGTILSLYGIYGYFIKQNGGWDDYSASLFRIASIFDNNPPTLALFLSLIIPLSIYRIYTLRGTRQAFGVILLLILIITLIMTVTRTTFVSLPISLVVLGFFLPSRKTKMVLLCSLFLLGMLVLLVAVFGGVPLFERFFSPDLKTLNNRTLFWQALLNHFDPTKILGYGLNAQYVFLSGLNLVPSSGNLSVVAYDITNNECHAVAGCGAHSLFLGTLYDHGIIGLILLLVVFVVLLINMITGAGKVVGDHRILYGAALAAFINMLAQCFDSTDLWSQNIEIYFWVIVALPFALCWWNDQKLHEVNQETMGIDEISRLQTQKNLASIQLNR